MYVHLGGPEGRELSVPPLRLRTPQISVISKIHRPGASPIMSMPSELSILDNVNDEDETMMIDPFEVRMRFTTQLQHLSAAVTSSQKAAHYALKYRDLDEDLHSCILEQLERVRVSYIYSIELY
jgi:hypothetical protein